jgi:NAD(P)-dependent dehydrogenase (short-subunit alcohol dehydrogenase family)
MKEAEEPARRRVLITGAAGDIGRAAALRFASAGAELVLTDRRLRELETTLAEARSLGADTLLFECDQTDASAVEQMFLAIEAGGGLHAAFVNAGYGRYGPLLELDYQTWQRHVDVNLNGAFLVTQHSARLMARAGRGGAIVINASTAAKHVCDLLGAYAASKAGLAMMARSFASELGCHRITVNMIMPGVIETSMTESLLAEADTRSDILANTPVGRLGLPSDIAELVHFLCSESATFITGAEILVDGGQTIHGYPRWFSVDYGDQDGSWRTHAKPTSTDGDQ